MGREAGGRRIVGWLLAKGGPRLLGVGMIGLAAIMLGLNVSLLVGSGRYYGSMFIMGIPFLAMGFWSLITGKTNAPQATGPKPPTWWHVGFYALVVLSVCLGFYLAIHLKKPGALDF